MSVIIKDMEMPECCGDCPFQASRWTGDFCSAGQFMFSIDFDYRDKHPKCPLLPLPEGHGDLIDKKAFKADIDGFIECMTKVGAVVDGEMLWGKLLDALENAKPIVPAEGGTDDVRCL